MRYPKIYEKSGCYWCVFKGESYFSDSPAELKRQLLEASGRVRFWWLLVSNDQYELPQGVFDTVDELAKFVGLKPATIRSEMSRAKRSGRRCRFIRVRRDED